MNTRHTLEADLLHHQQSGDVAAQADTLMTLAGIAQAQAQEFRLSVHHDRMSGESFHLAIGLYAQAAEASQQAGHLSRAAEALHRVGQCLRLDLFPVPSEIISMYQAAIDLYGQVGNLNKQIDLYLEVGEHFRGLSRWAYEKALSHADELGDLSRQAHISTLLGGVHGRNSPVAGGYMLRAILLYQELGDRVNEGLVYLKLGKSASFSNYETAYQHFMEAYQLFRPLKDSQHLLTALDALMELAKTRGDFALYRRCYDEKVTHLQGENDKLKALSQLITMAVKYRHFADARYAYQQSVALMVKRRGEAWYYWEWGEMEYQQAGHHEMGIALCQWAVTLLQNSYGVVIYQKKLDVMRKRIPYRHKGFGHD